MWKRKPWGPATGTACTQPPSTQHALWWGRRVRDLRSGLNTRSKETVDGGTQVKGVNFDKYSPAGTNRANATQSRDTKLGLKHSFFRQAKLRSLVVNNQLNVSAHSELLLHSVIKLFITHGTEKQQKSAQKPTTDLYHQGRQILANAPTRRVSSEEI